MPFKPDKPNFPQPANEPHPITRREFVGGFGAGVLVNTLESAFESAQNTHYEKFIADQVEAIKDIISSEKYDQILTHPHLAYALVYVPKYLEELADPEKQIHVPDKILAQLGSLMTKEFRTKAMLYIEQLALERTAAENKNVTAIEVLPLENFDIGKGKENHDNAVDLFLPEGSPVLAMSGGLVVIAENGWEKKDQTSTSSYKGGNTVVIFNHVREEFYRYAHFQTVAVRPGQIVNAGDHLGTVGHTGANASRPGHGEHLHLDIRKYKKEKGANESLWYYEIEKRINNLR